jgi:hypothetical protein
MFLTHTELLPEDETIEEHRKGKDDEATTLAADRAGQGLFKGLFQRRGIAIPGFPHLGPIVDAEDGVERCPECAWELEDGECNHCGWLPGMGDGDSYDSDEDDRDISPVDDFHGPINIRSPRPAAYDVHLRLLDGDETSEGYGENNLSPPSYSIADDDSEGDMDTDEDDDEMNSFISNDEDADLPDEQDDDDESVHTVHGYNADSPARQPSSDSAEQSPAPARQFYGIEIELSSDPGSEDDSGDDRTTATITTQTSGADSDAADDTSEQATNYDSDESSIREISPPVVSQTSHVRAAKRRRIIDDDDDEDEPEESDDTAIRPPQASTVRMNHLRGQRQRRASNVHILQMPERRRLSVSPDDEPPLRFGRRGGSTFQASGANGIRVAARRGRPVATRVY